jgi:hypothetical protein
MRRILARRAGTLRFPIYGSKHENMHIRTAPRRCEHITDAVPGVWDGCDRLSVVCHSVCVCEGERLGKGESPQGADQGAACRDAAAAGPPGT